MVERIIRSADFAKRLTEACDNNFEVPDLHHGRGSWLQRELKKRHGIKVSPETIRKWFSGEARPRPDKLKVIAQLLQVDEAWLTIGLDQRMTKKEARAQVSLSGGLVTVVAGFMEMHGAHVSFPTADDKFAAENRVDIYAMIAGRQHFIHVSLGTKVDNVYVFAVPTTYESIVVLGAFVVGFALDIIEIKSAFTDEHATRHGGSLEVRMTKEQFLAAHISDFKKPI